METMLRMALFVVASDQGNFLFRTSLISPFPAPKRNEYMEEISRVIMKFRMLFSSVKNKKKNKEVPSDIQSNIKKLLRFIGWFPSSKLTDIKGIKNYFLPNGTFPVLSCMKKPSVIGKVFVFSFFDKILFYPLLSRPFGAHYLLF